MATATPAMGFGGFALMGIGAISSAIGAHDAAVSQKMAISAQAQLDQINARSTAMSMNANADLELINTKAGFESMSYSDKVNQVSTAAQAFSNEAGSALGELRAQNTADLGIAHAEQLSAATLQSADMQSASGLASAQEHAAAALQGAESAAALDSVRAGSQAASLHAGAQMDQLNASLYEMQAQSALLHGQYQEQDVRMQYAQQKSHAITTMARGGVDMSEGTSLAVRAGIDIMAERAAIQVQQNTLMQAFGSRMQEASAMVSAASKESQAESLLSMSKLSGDLNINAARLSGDLTIGDAKYSGSRATADATFAGSRAVAEAQLSGTEAVSAAKLNSALTSIGDSYQAKIADAQSEWTAAMIKSGLATAEATAAYKHTMAGVVLNNASAASLVKSSMADGISPTSAAFTSLLGSSGAVAGAWYQYKNSTGGA